MAISTNQKPTIYRNLYENTGPDTHKNRGHVIVWMKAHVFGLGLFYLYFSTSTFNTFSAGTVFVRQNLMSIEFRFWRIKYWKSKYIYNGL